MNYLAHALSGLDTPYFVAGTSTPDWLSVVDRKIRARSKGAQGLLEVDDERTRQLAAGVIRHHDDDRWFHGTRAFAELNLSFAVELREQLAPDEGFRPSFLGHITVEILLDAALIQADRSLVDRYYRALELVEPGHVEAVVNRVSGTPTQLLAPLVPHFISARFLYDYLDNDKLLVRLNQVMRRVRLPSLPPSLTSWLESARIRVAQHQDALLTPPPLLPHQKET